MLILPKAGLAVGQIELKFGNRKKCYSIISSLPDVLPKAPAPLEHEIPPAKLSKEELEAAVMRNVKDLLHQDKVVQASKAISTMNSLAPESVSNIEEVRAQYVPGLESPFAEPHHPSENILLSEKTL